MASNLRHEIEPSTSLISPVLRTSSTASLPETQQPLSPTLMLKLVDTALDKFTREVARKNIILRLLIGHAELLDALIMELEDADSDAESDPRDDEDLEQGNEESQRRERES